MEDVRVGGKEPGPPSLSKTSFNNPPAHLHLEGFAFFGVERIRERTQYFIYLNMVEYQNISILFLHQTFAILTTLIS